MRRESARCVSDDNRNALEEMRMLLHVGDKAVHLMKM